MQKQKRELKVSYTYCACNDFLHKSTITGNLIRSYIRYSYQNKNITTPDDREVLAELKKNVMKRKAQLYEIEQSLPQKNSLYLKVFKSTQLHS